jgi:hypothetical protein
MTSRGVHKLLAMLLFVTASACSAPPSKLPQTEVLRFGVSHMGGSYGFVVRSDGAAEYQESRPPQGEVKVTARVSEQELKELASLLRARGFCSNVSSRKRGVPDEARPRVSVRLEGLDCEVQMWGRRVSRRSGGVRGAPGRRGARQRDS